MNQWEWQLLEDKQSVDQVEIDGVKVSPGSRVRLRPRSGGDVLDIALAGQTATIEAVEQDYEGKVHICVVLDEDPGRDMGMLRQPGHRFFFNVAEVEPLLGDAPAAKATTPSILVAGIGNIFFGDDAFGVEVARRLAARNPSQTVRVTDFGIRSLDLAYALQDGYETVILVDAVQGTQAPGTVYVIQPDMQSLSASEKTIVNAHGMDPVRVLQLAASMGAKLDRILLVACQPADLGGQQGKLGLSAQVEAGVEAAVQKIESLIIQIERGQWPHA
jgi:hydrogenase maturation protease